MNNYTIGSLFDGSGGFPLAGCLCGIEPKWAAEVEPYPIAVTRSRFPKMRHLGDISKVNGEEIEPVDIITFGSPCQDLSVAGKRAGLKHEANGDEDTTRSGLFMEAVRIIKEMRKATDGKYPTFALWENVPGAFSSNKGEDFRIVCEALIKIVEPTASMPSVPSNGWAYADSYIGDGWSLAYRVFDAQYWGVPQRRRRIHLVLDLRGERAREVLFERDGVRGYFAEGRTPWQGAPAGVQDRLGTDDREGESTGDGRLDVINAIGFDPQACRDVGQYVHEDIGNTLTNGTNPGWHNGGAYTLKLRSGCEGGGKGALVQEDKSATLATNNDQYLFQPVPNLLLDDQGGQQISVRTDDKSPTLRAEAHGNVPSVICLKGNGIDRADTAGCNGRGGNDEACYTLNTIDRPAVAYAVDQGGGKSACNVTEENSPTLTCTHGGAPAVAYGVGTFHRNTVEDGVPTLTARGPGVPCYVDTTHADDVVRVDEVTAPLQARDYKGGKLVQQSYIVRRLTPTECARLQGFADRWGDVKALDEFTQKEYQFWLDVRNTHAAINGKQVKDYTVKQMLTWYNKLQTDSAEYKMWGNGIALPPALYCMQGIVDALNKAGTDDWML